MSGACGPSSAERSIESTNEIENIPPNADLSNNERGDVMSKVIHVSKKQFESEVLGSDIPVVVDFYATWCPPCRALEPVLDRLAVEFAGQVKFVKVNSDEESELVDEYDVTSLPTLIMVDEQGRNEGRYLGSRQESEIRLHLQKWLAGHEVATQ